MTKLQKADKARQIESMADCMIANLNHGYNPMQAIHDYIGLTGISFTELEIDAAWTSYFRKWGE